MKFDALLTVIFGLQWIALVQSELVSLYALSTIGASVFGGVGYYFFDDMFCDLKECCTEKWIHPDLRSLNANLSAKLFGQHIAHDTIMSALHAHVAKDKPPKALAMSFHGTGGTGKNYVAQMIVSSFCKKGLDSKYCHFFNGRNDFPLERELNKYKENLRTMIQETILKCGQSVFVFDEVDKMPKGLLSVLVPFLDYYSNVKGEYRKAIYIFLSNTGGNAITQELFNLWNKGMTRDKAKLQHFENLITQGAFNEFGGLQHSDVIENNVIDHYVPFLPLEEVHVKMCITEAFVSRGILKPTPEMMDEALSHVTYGPDPLFLYSHSGCKRLEQKVGVIVYRLKQHKYQKKEENKGITDTND